MEFMSRDWVAEKDKRDAAMYKAKWEQERAIRLQQENLNTQITAANTEMALEIKKLKAQLAKM